MKVTTNPNTNAAGIGGSLGILITWLLGHFGIDVNAEQGAAISTAVAALVLYIGRDGIRGVFRNLWRGKKTDSPPVVNSPPAGP